VCRGSNYAGPSGRVVKQRVRHHMTGIVLLRHILVAGIFQCGSVLALTEIWLVNARQIRLRSSGVTRLDLRSANRVVFVR
jgi:hypothetical protein